MSIHKYIYNNYIFQKLSVQNKTQTFKQCYKTILYNKSELNFVAMLNTHFKMYTINLTFLPFTIFTLRHIPYITAEQQLGLMVGQVHSKIEDHLTRLMKLKTAKLALKNI